MKSVLYYPLAFLASLLIFVGLPLLGWGLGDLSGFFAHPARVAYVAVIAALQLFAILYNPQVGRNQENRKSGVATPKMDLVLIQVFSLAVVILAPLSDSHSFAVFNFGDAGRIVGLVLIVPGFVLMQMAEKYLARQFSVQVTIQENHKLIQDGPYKFVRHPRYLGILIFFSGISLAFRSLLAVLVTVALLFVLLWRVSAEEKLMRREFGDAWEAYRRKSWKIIPFVF